MWAAAAKVAEVLEGASSTADGHVLLAPMESNVIPLPHQIHALSRAVSGDRVRYLLADEVGLGKTIEAGLIMRELKLRGLVRRILIVVPKGIASQWVVEMQTHFNEHFQLVLGRRHRHAATYGLRDESVQLGLVDVRSGHRLFGFGQAHGQAARLDSRAHSRLQPQPI